MKRIIFGVCVALLVSCIAVQAQTSGPQPSPEHKKLEVWAGNWTIQGEGKDSPSGSTYKFDWTMQGRWLPGGFFLEVYGSLKYPDGEDRWLEILGYDPVKKTYVGYVFNYNGTSFIYTMTLSDRTCFENGTSYSPDGKGTKWRQTWNFAPDLMSVTGKREIEKDGTWWTEFEAKGVKTQVK